jgi:hypothetical protein
MVSHLKRTLLGLQTHLHYIHPLSQINLECKLEYSQHANCPYLFHVLQLKRSWRPYLLILKKEDVSQEKFKEKPSQ